MPRCCGEPIHAVGAEQRSDLRCPRQDSNLRHTGKDEFPTQHVHGDTAGPVLRLITCGGDSDHPAGHYVDNMIVFARLD